MRRCKERVESGKAFVGACTNKAKYILKLEKGMSLTDSTELEVCGVHKNEWEKKSKRFGKEFSYTKIDS